MDGQQGQGVAPVVSEGRRSRRRRELHEQILATAADLFARDGFDATTVERIATAADIAPATFFNHFRSKEDVLREVGRDVFTRFRRLVDEQLEREVGSIERLHGFADRSAALVRRAPEMTRRVLIAVLRSSRPGESGEELAQMQSDFARLLHEGRSSGDVPPGIDVDLVAEILVSVVIGAMTHWINNPDYPLESRLRESLSLLADRLLAAAPAPAAGGRGSGDRNGATRGSTGTANQPRSASANDRRPQADGDTANTRSSKGRPAGRRSPR